ncbi:hypothetical protein K503DRAFT_766292 [Rhizopogon vinicolor AM-OR11-026]|uniref:Uncharacterized protein n=1 Tax=Rhizopogon vinicolor AM-OR11-026 TaxID=1314800 RepID=A0A1B7NDS0_9AGAM|nr:hypothetical protein K503DRAFT_766292 [Rhizopogon vinicolor AM-OR11-026]
MSAATTRMPPTKSRDPHPVKVTNLNQSAPHPKVELKEPHNASGRSPVTKQTSSQQVYTKKIPHRSSKPIINWFQRKLAGTVKTRRAPDTAPAQKPPNGKNRPSGASASHSRSNSRSVSSPLPQVTPSSSQRQGVIGNGSRNGHRLVTSAASNRKTISLNGEGDLDTGFIHSDDEDLDASTHRSSLARDSLWSPASALEADEDASLRPLPPSAPPSPSLSHSSSSYLSNPRTFRSIAASTKPTTVLSIDLGPAGVGHIAQVPVTPVTPVNPRFQPHARSSSTGTNGVISSGASITFSALPPQSSSRSQSSMNFNSSTAGLLGPTNPHVPGLQAPLYTAYHPRNNPRPSSPPMDNASVLTLASSAYAMPGARLTMGSMGSATLSGLLGGGDSISHLGDSFTGDGEGEVMSQFVLGDDERQDVDVERDVDASVRALRPRSSRRGSWDSEVSGWSARILGTGGAMSLGSKSLWTNNSTKTGGPPGMDDEGHDEATGGLETSLEDKSSSETQDQNDEPVLEEPVVGDGQHSTKETVVEEPSESFDDVPATLSRATGPTVISKLSIAET